MKPRFINLLRGMIKSTEGTCPDSCCTVNRSHLNPDFGKITSAGMDSSIPAALHVHQKLSIEVSLRPAGHYAAVRMPIAASV